MHPGIIKKSWLVISTVRPTAWDSTIVCCCPAPRTGFVSHHGSHFQPVVCTVSDYLLTDSFNSSASETYSATPFLFSRIETWGCVFWLTSDLELSVFLSLPLINSFAPPSSFSPLTLLCASLTLPLRHVEEFAL